MDSEFDLVNGLTATEVAGRNTMVMTAKAFIAELSFPVAMAI